MKFKYSVDVFTGCRKMIYNRRPRFFSKILTRSLSKGLKIYNLYILSSDKKYVNHGPWHGGWMSPNCQLKLDFDLLFLKFFGWGSDRKLNFEKSSNVEEIFFRMWYGPCDYCPHVLIRQALEICFSLKNFFIPWLMKSLLTSLSIP